MEENQKLIKCDCGEVATRFLTTYDLYFCEDCFDEEYEEDDNGKLDPSVGNWKP